MRKIWSPEIFQGHGKKNDYFEGWYYKLIDVNEENIWAIIPGVSMTKNKKDSHSFIQMIDGKTCNTYYFNYSLDEFQYSNKIFEVRIGNSFFSRDNISLDIAQGEYSIKGDISFHNITPWPKTKISPGAMGWFSFMPFMECYHGVLSLNHKLKGQLYIDNKQLNFNSGLGYMEKDWGRSFPRAWVWIQSNHFNEKNTSIMVSIAKIPYLGTEFMGFIVGFLYEDKVIRFATYTGAKLHKIEVKGNKVYIVIKDKYYEMIIEGEKHNAGSLASPSKGKMTGKVDESITSKVRITLYKINGNHKILIFEGEGRNTGMEIKSGELLII